MFVCAIHVALSLGCLTAPFPVLTNIFGAKHREAVFCCQSGFLLLIDVHSNPLGALGGEVAVVVYVECTLLVARGLQDLAYPALCIGPGLGNLFEVPWSP